MLKRFLNFLSKEKCIPRGRLVNKSTLIDDVLSEQKEIIEYTKRVFGTGKIDKKEIKIVELFDDVIKNYTEYCYTLPASEGYHHARENGLIIHSLQVANRALRHAKNKFLPATKIIDIERQRTSRYYYAAWLCGLLHDAGKLYTDMIVSDAKNKLNIWQPLTESFISWKLRTNVESHRVEWRKDRLHKKHDNVSINVLHYVLTPSARKFISECPDDLLSEITDTLSGYQHKNGYIHDAVRVADTISTAEDIRMIWDGKLGPRLAALHEKIIKTMQELSGSWILKKELIILQDEVYIRWPQCIEQIIKKLLTHDSGIPHKSSTLLTTMRERGIVKGLLDEQYAMYYSDIKTEKEALELLRGKSVIGGKGFIRLEWSFHALGDRALPKNSTGLLKINDFDAILLTTHTNKIFTEEDVLVEQTSPISDSPTNAASTSNEESVVEMGIAKSNNEIQSPTTKELGKNEVSTSKEEKKPSKGKTKKIKPKQLEVNPLLAAANNKKVNANLSVELSQPDLDLNVELSQPDYDAQFAPSQIMFEEVLQLESDYLLEDTHQYGSWVNPNKEIGRSEEYIQQLIDNDCFVPIDDSYMLCVDDKFNKLTESNPNTINILVSAKYLTPKSRVEHLMFLVIGSMKYLPLSKRLLDYLLTNKPIGSVGVIDSLAAEPPIEDETTDIGNDSASVPMMDGHVSNGTTSLSVTDDEANTKKMKKDKKIIDRPGCNAYTIKASTIILKSLLDRGVISPLSELEEKLIDAMCLLDEDDFIFVDDLVHISFNSLCTKGVKPAMRSELILGATRDFEGNDETTYIEY